MRWAVARGGPAGTTAGPGRQAHGPGQTKEGRRLAASLGSSSKTDRSGERGFALPADHEQLVADLRSEDVLLLLEPGQLGLQVPHAPLKPAHFRYDAGVRPADVAE